MNNPYLQAELTKPGGIAERLTAARTRANLTGKDLAVRSGFPASKISKLELGQQMPTADDVNTYLRACSASVDSIVALQMDLEELRQAYPALHRQYRAGNRADPQPEATTLAEAYSQGYAAALRDVRTQVEALGGDQ